MPDSATDFQYIFAVFKIFSPFLGNKLGQIIVYLFKTFFR
jgi:hypothetical protein